MERLLYKRYGIGAVFLILAIVFIFFGIKNAGENKESEPYYTTVTAVITEKYVSAIEELDSFADVTYTDLSGIERSGRIAYNGSASIGDTIEIEMSTHNPAVIGFSDEGDEQRQTEEKSQNKRYAVIEIAVGAVLLVLGIFLIIRRLKSENAPEEKTVPRTETAKPAPVSPPQTAAVNYDLEEILKKVDEQIPPKPVVKLEPKRSEKELSVFESKLGGVPYMPADFEYPKGRSGIFEGRPLRLLAQLNFEKLPHIENFPQKGILQFFCSDEKTGAYGLNFKKPIEQDGFRIIYHENIIADESRLMPKENMPKFTADMGNFPFDGEFLLETKEPESCPVSSEDYHFTEAVYNCLNEIVGREIKSFVEAEEAGFGDDFWNKIYDAKSIEQTCIGGYPFFTQGDPREYKEEMFGYDVLLFQCASSYEDNRDDEIMWGDMGVGNFFITEKDLKNLDFSKVAYNWDCG